MSIARYFPLNGNPPLDNALLIASILRTSGHFDTSIARKISSQLTHAQTFYRGVDSQCLYPVFCHAHFAHFSVRVHITGGEATGD